MKSARNLMVILIVGGLLAVVAEPARAGHGRAYVRVHGHHHHYGPAWQYGVPPRHAPYHHSPDVRRWSYYPPVYVPPRRYYRPGYYSPYSHGSGGFSIYTPRFGFSIGF